MHIETKLQILTFPVVGFRYPYLLLPCFYFIAGKFTTMAIDVKKNENVF
jgi:hypothetical protein